MLRHERRAILSFRAGQGGKLSRVARVRHGRAARRVCEPQFSPTPRPRTVAMRRGFSGLPQTKLAV